MKVAKCNYYQNKIHIIIKIFRFYHMYTITYTTWPWHYWLWIAYEPHIDLGLMVHISAEYYFCMLSIPELPTEFGSAIFIDGAIWCMDACKWLRLIASKCLFYICTWKWTVKLRAVYARFHTCEKNHRFLYHPRSFDVPSTYDTLLSQNSLIPPVSFCKSRIVSFWE